jgi:hypothetical protein
VTRRPATRGGLEGWLGHGLPARSSRRGGPRDARAGLDAAWSPHAMFLPLIHAKHDADFVWGEVQKEAFKKIKR